MTIKHIFDKIKLLRIEIGVIMNNNVEIDIDEIFSEKHQKMFFDKLRLDLDNNADTFKLATKNIIKIEIAKLLSSLKKIYDKYSVDIDDEVIKHILNNSKNSMLESTIIVINEKRDSNKDYISNQENKVSNTKKFLKEYNKQIDNNELPFEENLNLTIKEETEISLYNELTNAYSCVNEEMHQDILTTININFSQVLFNRISSESRHRNQTLKNMADEAYKKYLDLDKSRIIKKESVKIKSLQELK